MADMDVFAAMGISGFGKATVRKQLDPSRFDKSKREEDSAPLVKPVTAKPIAGPSDGPSSKSHLNDEESENDESGPAPAPLLNQGAPMDEPEYDPSDQENDDEDLLQFPITHEITLKDHTKVVSGLALDPSGARIVSGSHDYDCKLWDFGGMDMRCKPFKSWEPAGTYHIHDLNFSNDGTKFLCISGTTQAKIFDWDGEEQRSIYS
jgi:WD40 repeat protein